jgi:hypothetical protein
MRRVLAKFLGCVAISLLLGVGALSLTPSPASADLGISFGWSGGYGFSDRYWDYYRPHYKAYVRPYGDPYWRGYRGGHYPTNVYRSNCRPIFRDQYRYGRVTRLGATQCIDPWGRPYIVRGSEFRIDRGHW